MEKLHAWQPVTFIKGRNNGDLGFMNVSGQIDHFKISFTDQTKSIIDVIYDQTDGPIGYSVWSYRYSTEYGRFDLLSKEMDRSGIQDPHALYFYKVTNSDYIKWFDMNPLINGQTNPKLEHHLYLNGNDIIEVLSEYEPRFVQR